MTDLFTHAAAKAAADLGMQRSVDHADRADPCWSERAYDALVVFTGSAGEFTAEEARAAMHAAGLALPTDGRAWGAIFKRAAKVGLIVPTGNTRPRLSGNMTPTIVWKVGT